MKKDKTVFIIGAPRSGTNMLRDMLIKLEGLETWPCDEINYIWRHGNVFHPTDEFNRHMASQKVKSYLRNEFSKFRGDSGAKIIVEKTCANCLRVEFIDEVFPEAKFIYIERDGADVIGSAKLRWTAKINIQYILKKVRYVPIFDIPYYATRYFGYRLFKLYSKRKQLASWGPVSSDMKKMSREAPLSSICATQWVNCVEDARQALGEIDKSRVLQVKYERFVKYPDVEFKKVAEFVGVSASTDVINSVVKNTSSTSVGKGRAQIDSNEVEELNIIAGNTLAKCGYPLLYSKE